MARRGQPVSVVADHAFVDEHVGELDCYDELSAEQREEIEARLRYCHLAPAIKTDVDALLRGHVEVSRLPGLPPRTVRLFVSSTHTDFVLEKEALIKETFPELRAFCRQSHGIDLQVIDARWGQAERSYPYHDSLELYSRELCRSTASYHGPHQLVLLGDKLGVPAVPIRIPVPLYDLTVSQLEAEGLEVSLLHSWYYKDMNALPEGEYRLHNIHDVIGEAWEEREWQQTQEQLRRLLQTGAKSAQANSLINEDELHQICGNPLLLDEVELGMTTYRARMLCVRRTFTDMEQRASTSSAPLYTDLVSSSNSMDTRAAQQRDQLTTRLSNDLQDDGLFYEASIPWSEPPGMDPAIDAHSSHIKNMCKFVYSKAKQLIEESVAQYSEAVTDQLYQKNVKHWTRAAELTRCVYNREDVLARIEDYIVTKTSIPLLISGHCGQGKSTVIGVASQLVNTWLKNEGHKLSVSVITRFCGHTERSSDIRPLLEDICQQVAYCTGSSIQNMPKEYKNQTTHLRNILRSGNFRGLLVLFVDGLDQLEPNEVVSRLDWLPFSLPNNVKIILSTSTHNNHKVMSNLRKRYPQSDASYSLGQLRIEDSTSLLLDLLRQHDRRISDQQLSCIVQELHKQKATPLDVESVAILAAQMTPEDTVTFQGTSECCLKVILDKVQNKYPKVYVTHALIYLTVANGLGETELYDVLSLDDEVLECLDIVDPTIRRFPVVYWTRLFGDIKDFFATKQLHQSDVIYWRHSIFKSVAVQRYCGDSEKMKYIHTILGDYYKGRGSYVANPTVPRCSSAHGTRVRQLPLQPNVHNESQQSGWKDCHDSNSNNVYNKRRQEHLPRCLMVSEQIQELNQDVLFNFHWIHAKLKSQSVYAVLRDYEEVGSSWEAQLVHGALKMSEVALKEDPDMLSTQLLSRLLQYYHKHAHIRKLLYDADLYGNRLCAYVPNWQSCHSPGAVLEYCHHIDLSEYNAKVGTSDVKLHNITMETSDKFYLMCKKDSSPKVYTWDIINAFESVTYEMAKGKAIFPSPCGKFINCFTDRGKLQIYNVDSSLLAYEVGYGKPGIYPSHLALSSRYTAFVLPGVPGPHIVDITAGTELRKLTYQCTALAFTADSRMLAINNGSSVVVVEMPLMTRKVTADLKSIPSKILFTDDHSKIYALTGQREVKVIHINYVYKQCTVEELHCGNVDIHDILLSNANDKLLITALYSMVLVDLGSPSSRIHIKEMPEGPFDDQIKPFNSSGFSSDDAFIVAGRGKYVAIWNTKGHPLRLLTYTPAPVSSMCLSRYSNKVLTIHENKAIQMWNLDKLREDTEFTNRICQSSIKLSANSPGGSTFMCVPNDSSDVVIYQASTNIVEHALRHGEGVDILAVEVSPGDKLGITVAASTDTPAFVDESWSEVRETKLWNLQTGQNLFAITNNVYTVFCPDGIHVIFCVCLEYDLSQPTYKVYNIIIATVSGNEVKTQHIELPEGTLLEKPVFISQGRYLCFVLCDGSYHTHLCLHSVDGRWPGIKYLEMRDILGGGAESTDHILSVRNVCEDQLLVIIARGVHKLQFGEEGLLDNSQPMSKCAVLYNVQTGTKQVLEEILSPTLRLDQAVYSHKAGVFMCESSLWCAKTGKLWKTSDAIPSLQIGKCCLLINKRYLAVVAESGSSVLIYRTSNMGLQTKVQLHGQIKQISTAIDDRTLAVTCTDARICLYTLTLAESDAMTDVIMTLPSRRHDVTPARMSPGRYGVSKADVTAMTWRDMMTHSKVNDFKNLTADDLVGGNGIRAFLS